MKLTPLKAISAICAAFGCLLSTASADIIEVSANITSDTRWTRDNVYVLTRLVYLLPPAKLVVEPGTVIRAANTSKTNFTNSPGSLVVSRGAKIIGNATVDDPIIFTSLDDPYVPGGAKTIPATITGSTGVVTLTPQDYSLNGGLGTNAFAYSKECGGLILLGRSPIGYDQDNEGGFLTWNGFAHTGDTLALPTNFTTFNTGNGTGFALIEGLTSTSVTLAQNFDSDGAGTVFTPSTTFNPGFFGGVDENDNSGTVRFWSHRYGGFNISGNNEINGITMGGCGRGTVLEFQEVAQNADDGFEWFGGYNNCRYLASVVNGDDCFDGDFGFSGNLQYLFAINDNESYLRAGFDGLVAPFQVGRNSNALSDKMVEWDGAEPDTSLVKPQTDAWAFNFTFIGNKGANFSTPQSNDSAIHLLKGADGRWGSGVAEDIGGGGGTGPLIFIGNSTVSNTLTNVDTRADVFNLLYFNIGVVSTGADTDNDLTTLALANVSQLRGKEHVTKNGLDPRLINDTNPDSIARDFTLGVATRPGVEDFFSPVRFRGAMRDNNWLYGWSWTHAVELMPNSNVERPNVTLSVTGATVSVAFQADLDETTNGDKVLYVVERSLDGRTWSPIGTVQDGSAADAPNAVLADADAAVGTIRVADSVFIYTGAVVHYRVIPQ